MTDPAENLQPGQLSDFQKLMATLNSFGSTMDTHGQALTNQQHALTRHEEMLQQIATALQGLTTAPLQALPVQPVAVPPTQPPVDPPAQPAIPAVHPAQAIDPSASDPHRQPRLPAPQRYDGKQGECRDFLTQCQLTFELQPATYTNDRARIAYVITLLVDKARAWATSVWQRQGPECSDFNKFTEDMIRVFDQSVASEDAAKKLMSIQQGKTSVADYAIAFRTLSAVSGWNEPALVSAFHHGLSDPVKDGLASVDCPSSLESLIAHAIRLDNRLRERRRDAARRTPDAPPGPPWPSTPAIPETTEPMQIGRTRLSAAEKERRRRERCCLYCGKKGHFRDTCPELSGKELSRPAEGGL